MPALVFMDTCTGPFSTLSYLRRPKVKKPYKSTRSSRQSWPGGFSRYRTHLCSSQLHFLQPTAVRGPPVIALATTQLCKTLWKMFEGAPCYPHF